jgi:hypothetical protein
MIGRSLSCTMMLLGTILVPAVLTGCENKTTTSPTNKDSTAQSGKDKEGGKPTPPERDPG